MFIRKRGEFGFVWFFAIIAGVSILLLSIYGAVNAGKSFEVENEASISKKIGILTDPLEAGFTSATFGTIKFQKETEIQLTCVYGGFGYNSLIAKTVSKIDTGSSKVDVPVRTSEKYIFGERKMRGKNFYVLSKAFDFPFKIADYVIIIPDENNYCFKDASESVREELASLRIPAVHFDNCSRRDDMIMVCFGTEGCDISVTGTCNTCPDLYETGVVNKDGQNSEYAGSLIYAAIFSDKRNYECNVNRLMYRGSTVSMILSRKAGLMNARDCGTNLESAIATWSVVLKNATHEDLGELYPNAVDMEEKSKWEVCNVW